MPIRHFLRPMAAKGSLKDNVTFRTPMHPSGCRRDNSKNPDIPSFRALPAGRLNAQNCELIVRRQGRGRNFQRAGRRRPGKLILARLFQYRRQVSESAAQETLSNRIPL